MKRGIVLIFCALAAAGCDGANSSDDGTPPPEETPAPLTAFFADADGDGYGDPAARTEAEASPEGYVDNEEDCNDGNASVHPGAKDPAQDGIDQDCDGFFQWLPAEVEDSRFAITWTVDTEAREGLNELHLLSDPSGPSRNTLVAYDLEGRVVRSEAFVDGIPGTQFEENAYDDEGRLVERTRGRYTDPASPTISEVTRFVFSEGLKVGKTWRGDPASVVVQRSARWTYDDSDRLTLLELFSGDFEDGGSPVYTEIYTYDTGGFLIGLVRKDPADAISFATVLTNDSKGRPLTYKRYEGDASDPATLVSDSRRLTYDGEFLSLYLDFSGDFDDPASTLGEMFSLTHDLVGNLVEARYFDFSTSDGPVAVAEWTYDEHGNILSVTLPLDERPGIPIALDEEDPSLPPAPDFPTGPATASGYFLAPFDIVEFQDLPGLP